MVRVEKDKDRGDRETVVDVVTGGVPGNLAAIFEDGVLGLLTSATEVPAVVVETGPEITFPALVTEPGSLADVAGPLDAPWF